MPRADHSTTDKLVRRKSTTTMTIDHVRAHVVRLRGSRTVVSLQHTYVYPDIDRIDISTSARSSICTVVPRLIQHRQSAESRDSFFEHRPSRCGSCRGSSGCSADSKVHAAAGPSVTGLCRSMSSPCVVRTTIFAPRYLLFDAPGDAADLA